MKQIKSKIILFIVFVMCGLLLPVYSKAEEMEYVTKIHVNPLYADVISEQELKEQLEEQESEEVDLLSAADEEYCTSMEELAAKLRTALVARDSTATIKCCFDVAYDDSELNDLVLKHTGIGKEGDYLAFTYAGYGCSYSSDRRDNKYYYTFTFSMRYYTNAEQEAEVDAKLAEVYSELNLDSYDGVDKIQKIYSYICTHTTYDYTNLNTASYNLKYTAYAALINGTSVCQGYANLFYRMCVDNGIDCRIISGMGITSSGGGAHAWNIVKVGDLYYDMDSTWDAGRMVYGYYLKCESEFGEDHVRKSRYTDDSFTSKYPMATVNYAAGTIRITTQPVAQKAKTGYAYTSLSVVAESTIGNTLHYQWYIFEPSYNSWVRITSETNSTFNIQISSNPTWVDKKYRCAVYDDAGNTVYSDSVSIYSSEVLLKQYSINASGIIQVIFYFDVQADEGGKVVILGPNGIKEEVLSASGDYVGVWYNIPAKNMNDTISVSVYNASNTLLSTSTTSFTTILDSLKSQNTAATGFANATGEYGKRTTAYFSNSSDVLDELDEADFSSYSFDEEGNLPACVSYLGTSLILETAVTIRHYFSGDFEGYKFYLYEGDELVSELYPTEMCGVYYLDIKNIPPAEFATKYTIKLVDDNSVSVWEKPYSVFSYCNKVMLKSSDTKLKNLCMSIKTYSDELKAFFGI